MAKRVFGIGTTVRARITFSDPDTGVVTDPITVTVQTRTPAGVLTLYTYGVDAALVKQSTGIYYISVAMTEVGTYKWKWTGTASQKSVVIFDEADSEKEAGF